MERDKTRPPEFETPEALLNGSAKNRIAAKIEQYNPKIAAVESNFTDQLPVSRRLTPMHATPSESRPESHSNRGKGRVRFKDLWK